MTICDIDGLIKSGAITSFAQAAPHDIHSVDIGKYYGVAGLTNAPTKTHPYFYQVFKMGDKDRQVVAHNTVTGDTYQLIQHNGQWGAWKDITGDSAYGVYRKEEIAKGTPANKIMTKAEWLASLKGQKGDKGDNLIAAFATQPEVNRGLTENKGVSPKTLGIPSILKFKGNLPASFSMSYNTFSKESGMYEQGTDAGAKNNTDTPIDKAGMLEVIVGPSIVTQRYTTIDNHGVFVRTLKGGLWSKWEKQHQADDGFGCKTVITAQDWNKIEEDGIYEVRGMKGANIPPSDEKNGLLTVMGNKCNHTRQIFTPATTTGAISALYSRTKYGTTWGNWCVHGAMEFNEQAKSLTITL